MRGQRSRLRLGRPVWLQHAARPRQIYPSLSGNHEIDVTVVGAGITGAVVALAFAEAGVPVAVVEGGLAGRGSTAASSALLLQEPDEGLADLSRLYGPRRAKRLWQLSYEAARDFIALVRRLRITCDLTKQDTIRYAPDRDAAENLRREFDLRTRAGFAGTWLTPGALRRVTGIAGHGAIRTRGSGHFDPYRACTGILAAAHDAGTRVFERSRVLRISPTQDRVRIATDRGSIVSTQVVIATGYATSHFRPLAGRFRMAHTYVLATQPITASQRREIGLSEVMVWDTGRPYHYVRWTADHRLLLGGGDRPVRRGRHRRAEFADATRELHGDFESLLPGVSSVRIDGAWEGLFATTRDSLPYIGPHRLYPRHVFALGYGGNGMTFGFLAARLLLERWQGIRSDQALFEFGRSRR